MFIYSIRPEGFLWDLYQVSFQETKQPFTYPKNLCQYTSGIYHGFWWRITRAIVFKKLWLLALLITLVLTALSHTFPWNVQQKEIAVYPLMRVGAILFVFVWQTAIVATVFTLWSRFVYSTIQRSSKHWSLFGSTVVGIFLWNVLTDREIFEMFCVAILPFVELFFVLLIAAHIYLAAVLLRYIGRVCECVAVKLFQLMKLLMIWMSAQKDHFCPLLRVDPPFEKTIRS